SIVASEIKVKTVVRMQLRRLGDKFGDAGVASHLWPAEQRTVLVTLSGCNL
ncbi:MAG: hypothetical protein QOC89_2478, partial [Paraburkholderia sp.]|nr:hypothetical protein [Paraburkholderia sp.]